MKVYNESWHHFSTNVITKEEITLFYCIYDIEEMANEDFIEEFNITEGDLDSALNPTRRRGRQSKEEAIYGKISSRYHQNLNT
jgi:hypothetical protein